MVFTERNVSLKSVLVNKVYMNEATDVSLTSIE